MPQEFAGFLVTMSSSLNLPGKCSNAWTVIVKRTHWHGWSVFGLRNIETVLPADYTTARIQKMTVEEINSLNKRYGRDAVNARLAGTG
jgi:hypothetical protein